MEGEVGEAMGVGEVGEGLAAAVGEVALGGGEREEEEGETRGGGEERGEETEEEEEEGLMGAKGLLVERWAEGLALVLVQGAAGGGEVGMADLEEEEGGEGLRGLEAKAREVGGRREPGVEEAGEEPSLMGEEPGVRASRVAGGLAGRGTLT